MELAHCISWDKIPDLEIPKHLDSFKAEGGRYLVASEYWGQRELREPGWMDKMYAMLAERGLEAPAAHGLWRSRYDLSTMEPDGFLEQVHFLEQVAAHGATTFTIHPGGRFSAYGEQQEAWQNIRRNAEKLIPFAEKNNIVLAFENSIGELTRDLDMYVKTVRDINSPWFRVCFDSGHAHASDGLEKSLQYLEPFIVTCHLHDNYGTLDNHNTPGQGTIDWPPLVRKLKSIPTIHHVESEATATTIDVWKVYRDLWYA